MTLTEFLLAQLDAERTKCDGTGECGYSACYDVSEGYEATIAAVRAVVKLSQQHPEIVSGGYAIAMDDALRLLALPYADHPGYREEWRP